MRTNLTAGTVIALCCDGIEKSFCIDQVIGDGANCIAYKAHQIESTGAVRDCRIKECYPFNAQVDRRGTELVWSDLNERSKAFDKLRRTHQLAVQLRNNEDVGNNITSAELCEGNGTLYSVMEINHARTYDKDTDIDCFRILETARVLAEVVASLHNQGYLHLDIKPGNFLVNHKPNTNIWLFDVDSFTPIAEIEAGTAKSISFSQQWAAPEQLRGRIDKICPATDIYSIGAVLFEKLMGRPVSNDDIGLFADWDFSEPVFENVNPKIKRHLREIFHKTLAASVKRRYQTAEELAAALKKAADIAREGMPYLISNCPPITTGFIGRQHELTAIENAFKGNTRAVFLHGEGGIGKSVLSIAYASRYSVNYDAVLFVRYKDSLKNTLAEIEIHNYSPEKESQAEKLKELRKLLDPHVLLIIDNFDVPTDKDEYLDELLRYRAHIIFTTRTDFSGVYSGETVQIEVDQMSEVELMWLFCRSAKMELKDEQRPCLLKLLETACYNTYVTELLGLQIAASGCSLESLVNSVTYGLNSLAQSEKVRVQKDGRVIKHTVPQIMRMLFNMADLSDAKKQVLRNLFLIRFVKVTVDVYKEFTGNNVEEVNELNNLVEIGWVRKNDGFFELHDLVSELIKVDLLPDKNNCSAIYSYIIEMMKKCCFDITSYEEGGEAYLLYRIEDTVRFIGHFFLGLNLKDRSNRELVFFWLRTLISQKERLGYIGKENSDNYRRYGDIFIRTLLNDSFFRYLMVELSMSVSIDGLSAEENFELLSIELAALAVKCSDRSVMDIDNEEKCQDEMLNEMFRVFEYALAVVVDWPENTKKVALERIVEIINWLVRNEPSDPVKSFLIRVYETVPFCFNWSPITKMTIGIKLTRDEISEVNAWVDENSYFDEELINIKDIEEDKVLDLSVQELLSCDNKETYIRHLAECDYYSDKFKLRVISYCISVMWDTQFDGCSLDEWERILLQEQKMLDKTVDKYDLNNWHECRYKFDMNVARQAVIYALAGNKIFFNDCMKIIFELINRDLQIQLEGGRAWSEFESLCRIYGGGIEQVVEALKNIGNVYWVVSYLVDFVDNWEKYAIVKELSLRELFSCYENIVQISEYVIHMEDTEAQDKGDIYNLYNRYKEKLRDLAGASKSELIKNI